MRKLVLFILWSGICATSGAQSILSGIIWEDERYHALPLKWNYGHFPENIPSEYTIKPFCPRVVVQTSLGTSSVWAAVWYGQTMSEAVGCNEREINAITKNAFSPLYVYRLLNPSGDCATAISLIDVLETMKDNGSPRFDQFKDLCPANLPAGLSALAGKNKINGYNKLFNAFDTPRLKTEAMKLALHSKHPVIIGITTPTSFQSAKDFWQPRETPDTTRQSAQALCIVGYDDQKLGGAFEVVNHRGPQWGKKGFTWISYDDMAKFARYGFELIAGSSCDALAQKAKIVFFQENGAVISGIITDNQYHKVTPSLNTGTRFKISMQSKEDGFAYVLLRDSQNKATLLFPHDKTTPYLNGNLTLPNENSYFQLEGKKDKNMFFFIFAQREIDTVALTKAVMTNTLFSISGSSGLKISPEWKDLLNLAVLQMDQF